MIHEHIIEQMDSEQKKAAAHTANFIQEIQHAPFSENIKAKMIVALQLTIELLAENETLRDKVWTVCNVWEANEWRKKWSQSGDTPEMVEEVQK